MNLKELRSVCRGSVIELHSSYDGKLVASSFATLDKYNDVEVVSFYPKIKSDKDENWAKAYLYVFGSSVDIDRIKQLKWNFYEVNYYVVGSVNYMVVIRNY